MRSQSLLLLPLLLPATAAACGGMGFSSRPDIYLTTNQQIWIHLRTAVPLALVATSLLRFPALRGRVARVRPTYLLLFVATWALLAALGIHTKDGFFSPDIVGYGSLPLAAEAALMLVAPLAAWTLLRQAGSFFMRLWRGGETAAAPAKKDRPDAGGREEPAAGRVPLPQLVAEGVQGGMLLAVFWTLGSLLEVSQGGQPLALVRFIVGLP